MARSFSKRLGTVDHEARMHFDGDLHSVIGGELGALDPIRRDHFVPLPAQHFQIFRRPWAGHPVGIFRGRRIAGASAEIDHHGHAQFFGQQNGLAVHFAVVARVIGIRMQRISVAAQGADGESLDRSVVS